MTTKSDGIERHPTPWTRHATDAVSLSRWVSFIGILKERMGVSASAKLALMNHIAVSI
jgi:hypothetical protein